MWSAGPACHRHVLSWRCAEAARGERTFQWVCDDRRRCPDDVFCPGKSRCWLEGAESGGVVRSRARAGTEGGERLTSTGPRASIRAETFLTCHCCGTWRAKARLRRHSRGAAPVSIWVRLSWRDHLEGVDQGFLHRQVTTGLSLPVRGGPVPWSGSVMRRVGALAGDLGPSPPLPAGVGARFRACAPTRLPAWR